MNEKKPYWEDMVLYWALRGDGLCGRPPTEKIIVRDCKRVAVAVIDVFPDGHRKETKL